MTPTMKKYSNILKVILNDRNIKKRFSKLSTPQKNKLKNTRFVFLDFDGVLTDNKVFLDQTGKEMVCCDRSDTFGVKLLNKQANIFFMIISSEKNKVVAARAKKLGIPCRRGVNNKLSVLKRAALSKKIDLKHSIYIGNDINDLDCFQAVGLAIAVADSYPPIKKYTHLITASPGGNGALREICELLIMAQLAHNN